MGIVGLVVERIRALCFEGPVDAEPVLRALRGASDEQKRALVAALQGTYMGRALASLGGEQGDALEVALEESIADSRSAIAVRLQALRVTGSLSSFLGFVGAAIELNWIQRGEHGLLALDPTRVAAIGMNGAALSIALGMAGSSFALGAWMTLRTYASRMSQECERVVDRVRPAVRR